jgi:hypothetical protein
MVYPRARHGGFGRHNQRQFYEFIRRTMFDGEPTRDAPVQRRR